MRVLCCYTSLHPASRASLAAHAPGAELADVSGDPFGYWREISARWDGSQDLITVEHDIEIHAGVLDGFSACPEPWCVYPYPVFGDRWLDFGLGCTRFAVAAQQAAGVAAIEAMPGECELCGGAPGCWRHADCRIALAMHAAGIRRHVHWPAVTHLGVQVPEGELRWHRHAQLEAS